MNGLYAKRERIITLDGPPFLEACIDQVRNGTNPRYRVAYVPPNYGQGDVDTRIADGDGPLRDGERAVLPLDFIDVEDIEFTPELVGDSAALQQALYDHRRWLITLPTSETATERFFVLCLCQSAYVCERDAYDEDEDEDGDDSNALDAYTTEN